MSKDLKSFHEIVRELSEEYGVPYEIVEHIIISYVKILYFSSTGREVNE